MATLTIRFTGELGALSADSFALVLNESLQVLKDLDFAISNERTRTVKWVVSGLREPSPAIVLESRLLPLPALKRGQRPTRPDRSTEIRQSFTQGVSALERGGTTPPFYSTDNVKSIERIVKGFFNNGMNAVSFEADDETEAILTPAAAPNLKKLTGVAYHAWGEIEGFVQIVNVRRGRRRFSITHARTFKSISCTFLTDIAKSVIDALSTQQRVVISGRISYNAANEPISVSLSEQNIRFLRPDEELPTIADLAGSAPDITNGMSTEDFVRSLRDG